MSCVNAIATYIASMGCHLYQKDDFSFNRVENSITNVLSRPNKIQGQFDFMKEMIIKMLLEGDSFAVMNFHNGKLISLEQIEGARLSESILGSNIWQVTGTVRGKYITVPYENTLHFRDLFNRFDALRPILESKVAANKLVTKAFENGLNNNVKAWIELQGTSSESSKMILKSAFNRVLTSNDDNIAVLDEGMKLNPISGGTHSFQESQVAQLTKDLDAKIHQVMNVPSVITSVAEGTYNISDSLKSNFIQSLLPFLKMIEQEFFEKLLTRKEKQNYYFKINYRSLMRGNDKDRMDYYRNALLNGIMSQAEVRRLEDLPYIKGTDDLLMSLNYVPITKYDTYIENKYGMTKSSGENIEGEEKDENIKE
nr:MAG TPA: portal protein [Caudoviricetes sp.]